MWTFEILHDLKQVHEYWGPVQEAQRANGQAISGPDRSKLLFSLAPNVRLGAHYAQFDNHGIVVRITCP